MTAIVLASLATDARKTACPTASRLPMYSNRLRSMLRPTTWLRTVITPAVEVHIGSLICRLVFPRPFLSQILTRKRASKQARRKGHFSAQNPFAQYGRLIKYLGSTLRKVHAEKMPELATGRVCLSHRTDTRPRREHSTIFGTITGQTAGAICEGTLQ